MNTSRRNALKWMAGSLLTALSPLVSYSHSVKSPVFSGEAMYRGIFFAEGDFANLIPEIKSLKAAHRLTHQTAEQLTQATNVRQQIVQEIKQRDSLFFDRFKAAMISQNVLRIQRNLLLASQRTSAAVETLYGTSGTAAGKYTYEKRSMSVEHNAGTGTVLLVANAVACVNVIYILSSAIIVSSSQDEEMVSTSKASTLLLEQIALSVCNVTRTVA